MAKSKTKAKTKSKGDLELPFTQETVTKNSVTIIKKTRKSDESIHGLHDDEEENKK